MHSDTVINALSALKWECEFMELDQLRYFLQVADRGNFTRAAEDLMISQPALSRSIQKLEDELGQPVFERKTRSISLTDAGELLVSQARRILGLVDDTKAAITDDGESGRIRVAAIPTIAPYFLPDVLRRFATAFPRATISVYEDTTDNLLKRCGDGAVDVAIAALPIAARYLEVEPLFEEELLLVLAPDHPLAEKKQIRLKDIEPHPFVLLGEAHCLTGNIESFCHQKSFHPLSVERTSQLATVQELVSLNHGVSMIPAMARAHDESNRRIYRSISGQKPTRTIAMVWNSYRFQTRLMENFKSIIRRDS